MTPPALFTVLLVEDNPGDARLTREMLADAGNNRFRVLHVITLAEAIARVSHDTESDPFDVILLDLSLPDSHGLEGMLRLQAANPRLPIVVLTGLNDETLSYEVVQAGAQDYLVKGRGDSELMTRAIRYAVERKRAHMQLLAEKERAELANRTKSEFLANMSHELRTPLNAIIGFAEILQNELMGPLGTPCYKDYALNIRESGTHLLDIINDILDLSKIEAGKVQLLEEIIDLSRTIKSCTRLMEVRASNARITLVSNVSPSLPALRADERKIKQILINLLSNAVKFTPEGGQVTLSARRLDGGGIVITVEDTGIGIAAEDIAKALAPFNQIDNSLSRKYNGTGLGLPLAESFTRMHGGSLTLESAEGRGTCVTIYFPESRTVPAVA